MSKTEIYVNAYPRSGTAWLTRLLNDILPDDYIVRRGHFSLKNDKLGVGKFYELGEMGERLRPKQFDVSNITDEKIILLIRDPRDICVSGSWLWQQSVEEFLDRMIAGEVMRCGRWDEYCDAWLSLFGPAINSVYDFYENILESPTEQIDSMMKWLHLLPILSQETIQQSVGRQSFSAIKSRIGNDEQALRQAGLRKGIAGDWHNHFTDEMNNKMWAEFGWMMERLGYER